MTPSQTGNFGPDLSQRTTPSIDRQKSLVDVIMQSLRVAVPAVVQSFSPGPPATVTVLIATREYVTQATSVSPLTISTSQVELPILHDVPVQMPSAGGWSLTLPIQAGDECLVVFSDTSLDAWLQSGAAAGAVSPMSQRRHSLSDAIAVFGLRSTPRGLSGYSTSSAQLRNDAGSVVIDLAPGVVTVTAPTVTVNGGSQVNVNAPTVAITGSSEVDITGGSLVSIGSNCKIGGITMATHVHSDPQGGNTGPPH